MRTVKYNRLRRQIAVFYQLFAPPPQGAAYSKDFLYEKSLLFPWGGGRGAQAVVLIQMTGE